MDSEPGASPLPSSCARCRVRFLCGCWPEGLGSCSLAIGWQWPSVPCMGAAAAKPMAARGTLLYLCVQRVSCIYWARERVCQQDRSHCLLDLIREVTAHPFATFCMLEASHQTRPCARGEDYSRTRIPGVTLEYAIHVSDLTAEPGVPSYMFPSGKPEKKWSCSEAMQSI